MDSYPGLGVQKADNDTTNTPLLTASEAIYQLWKQVIGDTNLPSEFKEAWIARKFELGDELTQYNCVGHSSVRGGVVYLICQGKVRLLGFDQFLGKEVSIQLLDPNQFFGGDDPFCDGFQEYRAVASSSGMLLQISSQKLDIWLQRYPALFDYFSQITQERQKLIFFKTLTELRSAKLYLSQNTPTLQKLLAYFLNIKINAGSSLTASPREGRFWLVSGEICSISGKNRPPTVGESWGYPNPIPVDFISQTDLSLFYLPKQHFDAVAEIVPELKTVEVGSRFKVKNDEVEEDSKVESKLQPVAPDRELISRHLQFDRQHPRRRWFGTYPFVQQQSSSDCGAASLAAICQYWGKRFKLNTLRSIAHINSMGAEFSDLINAAETLGYQALGVRASFNELESQPLPWIAHYQGNHYIVVWRIEDSSVFISDPAIGKRWVSRDEFEVNFTGYALLLSPTENFYSQKNEFISFERFHQFFANNRPLLAKIIIVSILLPILGVVPAILAQTVIDAVTTAKNLDSINIFGFGFLVFGFGRIALTAVRQHLLDYLSNRLDITLIGDFVSRTLELPLSFFASRRVGDILGQIQENSKIHRFLTRQAITTILDGLMTLVYFGLMAYYSWQLTLVVVSFILPMMCLSAVVNLFVKKIGRQYAFDSKAQNGVIVEIVSGINAIKTEKAENSLLQRWEEHFTKMIKTRSSGQKLSNRLQLASSLINHIGSTTVLWYGTQMAINSQISIGEFIAFNMLVGNTINPMLALVKLWDEFPDILTSIEKLDDVLATESEEKTQKTLSVLPAIRGEVHFENVSFSELGTGAELTEESSQQGDILQNISFRVKPGQTIAIVGGNNCGKRALVKLLSGLYHADSGRILIDGHDITQVTSLSLRRQFGVISQEFFLFSGTILENITLYNREFSLEQVQAAAKLAGAHAFIEALPLGYSTIVGGGIKLDAKQQHKLAIARALVKNPRILIIDEANNSVDSLSEYKFQQKLARFDRTYIETAQIRTTFIVAPSLSSIKDADTTLVFDRGVLAEQGTHEELMKKSKIYPSLIQQQLDM
ncbi:cysteine peptidase family C39 domain-containing protein [Calothrix sp. CCY 0018]|uniref:cysteine peptidase family C39 domain-containing protein n=1 Tax=Calothrix sp. CCY 0018 TaxID=3103864 RepID=UPI0039C74BE8